MWIQHDVFINMQQFCVGIYEIIDSNIRKLISTIVSLAPTVLNTNLYLTFNYT